MSDEEMLKHYSAALDEIYRLRVAAAFEARILENALDYATLPKRVRARLADARARLDATACGSDAYRYVTAEQRQTVLHLCNAPMTLTRHEWETKRMTVPENPFDPTGLCPSTGPADTEEGAR